MKEPMSCKLPLHFICCLLLSVALSGCIPNFKYGVSPKVERLSELKVGITKRADVLMTLGEPRGKGAARFSDAMSQKLGIVPYHDIWFYEYLETDGNKVQLKFLLVFLDKDTYKGHFWFSSSELMEVERGL